MSYLKSVNPVIEALEEHQIDTAMVIRKRFMGREEMYLRFLKRFLEDENFGILKEKLKMGDVKASFFAAHTLKGVLESLGLSPLMPSIFPMVEVLRKDSLQGVEDLLIQAEQEYEEVRKILELQN